MTVDQILEHTKRLPFPEKTEVRSGILWQMADDFSEDLERVKRECAEYDRQHPDEFLSLRVIG